MVQHQTGYNDAIPGRKIRSSSCFPSLLWRSVGLLVYEKHILYVATVATWLPEMMLNEENIYS